MKKYISHIFILIALPICATLLVPAAHLFAEDVYLGVCTDPQGNKFSNYTIAECDEVHGTWLNSFIIESSGTGNGTIDDVIYDIHNILNSLVPLLVALGMVYFVWGVVQYVIGDSEEAKKKGKTRIIYGIIAFAVIISLWSLVNVVVGTFGLQPSAPGIANAPACATGADFAGIVGYLVCFMNKSVIPLIFALALLTFVFGVIKFFIIDANEEAKRSQGKQFMIWGIVALAVMLSLWGLVSIVGTTFHIDTSIIPKTKESQ